MNVEEDFDVDEEETAVVVDEDNEDSSNKDTTLTDVSFSQSHHF